MVAVVFTRQSLSHRAGARQPRCNTPVAIAGLTAPASYIFGAALRSATIFCAVGRSPMNLV